MAPVEKVRYIIDDVRSRQDPLIWKKCLHPKKRQAYRDDYDPERSDGSQDRDVELPSKDDTSIFGKKLRKPLFARLTWWVCRPA
jgi:hypothetical protein